MEKPNIKHLAKTEYPLWNAFLNDLPYVNVFQTIGYYEALKQHRWRYEVFTLTEGDDSTIVAGSLIQTKAFLWHKQAFAAINYGPIGARSKECFQEILEYLKRKHCLFIDVFLPAELGALELAGPFRAKLIGQQHTYLLDLTLPYTELFQKYSATHRNCARKGKKEGVDITFSYNKEWLPVFLDYYRQMTKRKGIQAIDPELLEAIISRLIEANNGFLAVASYQGNVTEFAMIATVAKTARYLYGASLPQPKGTPPIGQTLHNQIILHLQANGFSTYDLGGIKAENVAEDDDSYGVWKFKKGFGGRFVTLTNNYRIYFKKGLERVLDKIR